MSIERIRHDINKLADAINRLRLEGVDLTPIYNQLAQKLNISDFNNFVNNDYNPFKNNILASLFDIILYHDIETRKPIVFIPKDKITGETIIYGARDDDDALSYAKHASDFWDSQKIAHIIWIKDVFRSLTHYDFSPLAFLIKDSIFTPAKSPNLLILDEGLLRARSMATGFITVEETVEARGAVIAKRLYFSNNLSGINHLVPAGSTYIDIVFPEPYTAVYGVCVIPQWNTTVWVTDKTNTGFRVNFGTPPLSNSYIDWFIYENYPI
jgi:hypothetical protein